MNNIQTVLNSIFNKKADETTTPAPKSDGSFTSIKPFQGAAPSSLGSSTPKAPSVDGASSQPQVQKTTFNIDSIRDTAAKPLAAAGDAINRAGNWLQQKQMDYTTQATQQTPPLAMAAKGTPFESVATPMAQAGQWLAQDPNRFASLLSMGMPEITEAVASTPLGLPAIAGMRGLMAGGQSFTDAQTLFGPTLERIRNAVGM